MLRRVLGPGLLTVVLHIAVLGAIWAVKPPDQRRVDHAVDFDIVPEPPPKTPADKIEQPAPPPPQPETKPVVTPEQHTTPHHTRPSHPRPSPAPPAPGGPGEPAPGPLTTSPNADQPYQLGEPVPAAQAPGGTGSGGSGGGSGHGGGGDDTSAGGGRAPTPVSVAEIKTMPQPIGDTDFIEAHRDYPAEAVQLGIEGQVKVRLLVDAKGRVDKKSLVTRLGHGLDQLALRLAGKLHFRPAIDVHDQPVAATVVWTFNFTLPH